MQAFLSTPLSHVHMSFTILHVQFAASPNMDQSLARMTHASKLRYRIVYVWWSFNKSLHDSSLQSGLDVTR